MAKLKLEGSDQIIDVQEELFDRLAKAAGGAFAGEATVLIAKDGVVLMFMSKMKDGNCQVIRYGVPMNDLQKHHALYDLWKANSDRVKRTIEEVQLILQGNLARSFLGPN